MSKIQQLREIAAAIPSVNEQARAQADAARTMQLQQAVGSIAPGTSTRLAQKVAPGLAQEATKEAVQSAGTTAQQQAQVAGLTLQTQASDAQKQLAMTQLAEQAKLDSRKNYLSQLGSDLDAKLFKSRQAFTQDELGRKFTNERQLADWTAATAKSEQEFLQKMQRIDQANQQKMALLQITQKKLQDILKRGWLTKEQSLNAQSKKDIMSMLNKLEQESQKAQAVAKNRQATWTAAGTIVGAIGGSLLGQPVAGAMIGAGAGSAAAGATA